MELKVCKGCRRLFHYIYGPELCQNCIKLGTIENKDDKANTSKVIAKRVVMEDEMKYVQVKDYIMANPGATVAQIAEVNDIAPTKLLDWVRNDRLEFSDSSVDAWFKCEKCGTKIKSGRFCNRCKFN